MRILLTGLLLALGIQLSGSVRAEPIALYNQFPLHAYHLSFAPRGGKLPEEGKLIVEAAATMTNSFNFEDDAIIDSESYQVELTIQGGVTDSVELGVRNILRSEGAGVFDSVIDNWHDTFHLPKGKRHNRAKNSFKIEGNTDDGFFSLESHQLEYLGTSIFSGYALSKTTAFRSELLIPNDASGNVPSSPDLLMALETTDCLNRWELYLGGSAIYFSDASTNDLKYRSMHSEVYGGLSYSWSSILELKAQLLAIEESVQNVSRAHPLVTYLDTQIDFHATPHSSIYVSVRENPWPRFFTSDFSLTLGFQLES